MLHVSILCLQASLLIVIVSGADARGGASELEIIRLILNGYDPSVRPVLNEEDVLNLTISANSLSLLNMDQAAETITFSADFIVEWKDVFLKWNRTEYGNITWLKMKETQIWRPDVTVSTSIHKTELLDERVRYLDVRYDGHVRQSIYAVYTNLCNMKITRFPYDSQTCDIAIGPWSYTADEIYCREGTVYLSDSFVGNSEWDFENLTSSVLLSTDDDVGFEYTEILFKLVVQRRPLFYVWVLLIPTFIITTTCICGLFSPTNNIGDREEKVNLGLTTLLSSTVILEIIANSMPKTSVLPLLGNFILAEIFVVSIGVFCSVFVLFLHNKAHTRGWVPPNWILAILRLTGSRKFLIQKGRYFKLNKSEETEQDLKFTGEGSEFFSKLNTTLTGITSCITEERMNRNRELAWLKFFDRLDTLLLLIFQASNALVTFFICS
ncbi:unnamed protein product [Auanema sp. JU1783]|nr:unnamed protein product [Auanema sp. JU1783]